MTRWGDQEVCDTPGCDNPVPNGERLCYICGLKRQCELLTERVKEQRRYIDDLEGRIERELQRHRGMVSLGDSLEGVHIDTATGIRN